jgi:cytochrome c peroxidase
MGSGNAANAPHEMRHRGARPARIRAGGMRAGFAAGTVLLFTFLCGCKAPVSSRPVGPPVAIKAPLGLPPVPVPPGNPPTAQSIALGRRLFYDTSLSKDNSISCSSCHNPAFRFSDARERSIGVGGALGVRHAPTLVNVAYSPLLFWDGRAASLESQVLGPMSDPLEMNQAHEATIAKLKHNPGYAAIFREAFGTDDITLDRVENALGSFERTILCGNSAFDRYQYQGQKNALTPAQVRGLAVFTDPHRGNCSSCHTIGAKYALFTDGQFHNTGEGADDNDEFADPGRYKVTHVDADKGAFKTPTLRDVAISGPYMHDGKLKTLKAVVDFYAGKGNSNPNLDVKMKTINLTGQDRNDLVEFLKSLTGEISPNVGPPGEAPPEGPPAKDGAK